MSLLQGLVSYWKLEESSGTRVDKRGTVNLTANNTPGNAAGPTNLGNAAAFVRASSQDLSATSPVCDSVAGTAASFTVGGWVYYTAVPQPGQVYGIINKASGMFGAASVEYSFELAGEAGGSTWTYRARMSDGVTAIRTLSNTIGMPSTSTWYNFFFGWDAVAGTIFLSIDNAADLILSAEGSHNGSKTLYIGSRINAHFHNGRIDGVGFWNRKLRDTERTRFYNGGRGLEYPFGFRQRRPLRGLGRGISRGLAA